MPTILGIIGSPRKNGNTQILVERLLEGARAGGADTEMLPLAGLAIRECDGCYACWRGKPCSKQDDMNPLFERIAAADVLVFGTPVYWYGPTALMKAFIDRFVFFNCAENRPQVRGKTAAVVIPFEEENEETGAFVAAFFEKCFQYLEMRFAGSLLVPGAGEKGAVLGKPDRLVQAYRLGGMLARQALGGGCPPEGPAGG